jgi:hypothetical protein
MVVELNFAVVSVPGFGAAAEPAPIATGISRNDESAAATRTPRRTLDLIEITSDRKRLL